MRVGERRSDGGRAGCDRRRRRLLSGQGVRLTRVIWLGRDQDVWKGDLKGVVYSGHECLGA